MQTICVIASKNHASRVDKSLILREIKSYYGFKSNSEFARYLGIAPQVLSNWIARNTYDAELIYTKCEEISASYLLTGKGEMLRREDETIAPQSVKERSSDYGNILVSKVDWHELVRLVNRINADVDTGQIRDKPSQKPGKSKD